MPTISLSEIVTKTCQLQSKQEKIDWLRKNDSPQLRNILAIMFNKNFKFLVPTETPPPYTPSPHVESHGMLYREIRKMKYFIAGYGGENIPRIRREALFIQMLESVDRNDAELVVKMIMQTPPEGLDADAILEAFGPIFPKPEAAATTKKSRKRNVKE